MDITKEETKQLKGIAILLMLWLHLFSSADMAAFYTTTLHWLNGAPLAYTLKKWGAMCVAAYAFLGGVGLAATYAKCVVTGTAMRTFRRFLALYANLWVVFILFYPLGCLFNPQLFLASGKEAVLNFFCLQYTYNGAWWFLLPYAVITLCSCKLMPWLFAASPKRVVAGAILSLVAYVGSHLGLKYVAVPNEWATLLITLCFNTLLIGFSFLMGAICYKYHLIGRLRSRMEQSTWSVKKKRTVLWGIVCALALLKLSLGGSGLINPWFVFLFIPLYCLLPRSKRIEKVFSYFGQHSTNMWLTHYFFFYYIFGEAIYSLRYPVLIYGALVVLSLTASYVVGWCYAPIRKRIR